MKAPASLGLTLGLIALFYACSISPYRATNRVYKKQARAFGKSISRYPLADSFATRFVGTTNFSMRRPSLVVLHHTAQNSTAQTISTFTTPRTAVSSHYVVGRDGQVVHMLNDYLRGHHAGASSWGGATDLNSSSLGIEIDNNGSEPFSEAQISAVIELLGYLKKAFGIQRKHFVGHADIAPGRKVDPSRYFPWQRLAEAGYGLWYDTTAIEVPAGFDALMGLRLIGYDISKPRAAIQSYKIHYVPQDTTLQLGPADHKIIYSLMKQSL